MNKELFTYTLLSLATLFGCSKETSEPTPKPTPGDEKLLAVQATIDPLWGELSFAKENAIGLFITSGTIGSNYDDQGKCINLKSVYNGSAWVTLPCNLSEKPATVFAYYPYKEGVTGNSIPIETDSQIDYMFGTHTVKVPVQEITNQNSTVDLTMKHALSLVSFNFKKKNYFGAGRVSKIEIVNAPGKAVLATKGILNCSTGEITCSGAVDANVSIEKNTREKVLIGSIPTELDPKNAQTLKVLPLAPLQADGDVLFKFTIDGVEYTLNALKAGTTWKQGEQYTYNILFEGEDVNLEENFKITFMQPGDKDSDGEELVPFPEEAKEAILHAAKIWAACLDIKVPLTMKVGFANFQGTGAYSVVVFKTYGQFIYAEALFDQIVGYDSEPTIPDVHCFFDIKAPWYFGIDAKYHSTLDPTDPSIEYVTNDLVTVALHEIGHCLGIVSGIHVSDEGIGTRAAELDKIGFLQMKKAEKNIGIYDSFLTDAAGKYLSTYPTPSKELGTALSGKVFFNGTNAIKANNGKPIQVVTSSLGEGQNGHHLDSSIGPNLMGRLEIHHHPGAIVLGILQDIGWGIKKQPIVSISE